MHHQQRSRSLRFRTSSRAVTAALTMTIAFALAFVLIQSAQTQSFHAGGGSTPLRTQDPRQHARAFPRLSLGSGREVIYVGMFSSDATFRKSSKLTRFFDALNVPPSESPSEQAAGQSGVPSWMLSSNERVLDDIEPPGHAMALPQVHSLVGSARDAIVSFVYGRPSVLRTPQYLTTDSQQRVILSDPGIPAVHVLDPKRKTSFSILGGQGHRLQSPAGVAVDGEDNIYVADSERGMVLVYDQYGKFARYIGNFHGENMYQRPTGIAIDRKARHLYLADSPRHLIFMLDLEGHLLKRVGDQWDDTNGETLKSRKDIGPGKFDYPTEIAVSDHQVAVLDMAGTRVQIMDLECNLRRGFRFPNAYHQQADKENGLALDKHGSIYVSYAATSEVRMYNSEGGLLASFGQTGSKAGEFSAPRGLWVDASNRLYVSDTQNIRVQLFQLTGDQSDGMPNPGE